MRIDGCVCSVVMHLGHVVIDPASMGIQAFQCDLPLPGKTMGQAGDCPPGPLGEGAVQFEEYFEGGKACEKVAGQHV